MQPLGLLIVDDLVRLDAGAVVEQLHVADRRHPRVVVVVVDLVGLHQHLPVIRRTLRDRLGRSWIVGEALRERVRGEPEGARQQQAKSYGHRARATTHDSTLAQREQSSAEGGNHSHYPSSKYNKAKKPVRPPTHTGSHAEAIGCINSALLKSSVTLDKT
jgi:hypothetical protein